MILFAHFFIYSSLFIIFLLLFFIISKDLSNRFTFKLTFFFFFFILCLTFMENFFQKLSGSFHEYGLISFSSRPNLRRSLNIPCIPKGEEKIFNTFTFITFINNLFSSFFIFTQYYLLFSSSNNITIWKLFSLSFHHIMKMMMRKQKVTTKLIPWKVGWMKIINNDNYCSKRWNLFLSFSRSDEDWLEYSSKSN